MPLHKATRRAPSRESLLGSHSFPGEFVIKAFGPNSHTFRHDITTCAKKIVDTQRIQIHERTSKHNHKLCLTLTLQIECVEEVECLYEQIHDVPNLFMIL